MALRVERIEALLADAHADREEAASDLADAEGKLDQAVARVDRRRAEIGHHDELIAALEAARDALAETPVPPPEEAG